MFLCVGCGCSFLWVGDFSSSLNVYPTFVMNKGYLLWPALRGRRTIILGRFWRFLSGKIFTFNYLKSDQEAEVGSNFLKLSSFFNFISELLLRRWLLNIWWHFNLSLLGTSNPHIYRAASEVMDLESMVDQVWEKNLAFAEREAYIFFW